MSDRFFLGVDVGTGSVRAAVFDAAGARRGLGVSEIRIWRSEDDFVEQSSDDIWRAAGRAIRAALAEGSIEPARVAGVGLDATCSLVALDAGDGPVTVSPSGDDERNVVVWMDHRAVAEADRINAGRHEVLRYVGGRISAEMQMPKLLWLKENLPATWRRAARFLDLADFLTYRATGSDTRSLCTTVCKWTYLGHDGGRWDDGFFRRIGLGDLAGDGHARIGRAVRPLGERVGELRRAAAAELGLAPGTPVGVGIIDAHAGGLGLLGAPLDGAPPAAESLERRVALVGGTSSCHMSVSREPRRVPGVWGPYWSAMIPGMWLTEGGQSATGALVDHTIRSHARGAELEREAERRGTTVYALLNDRLDRLAVGEAFPAALTRDVHVLPYHHGNRSPRADPTLRGAVHGLRLTDGADSLALLYLATIQAVAHGTRHILDTMNAHGHRIDTILACGGDTKNPVFVREHADATGCRVVLPREPEAVLLGAAILGAVACGAHPAIPEAMAALGGARDVVEPAGGAVAGYHRRKHEVFHRLHEDQMAYRAIMER